MTGLIEIFLRALIQPVYLHTDADGIGALTVADKTVRMHDLATMKT